LKLKISPSGRGGKKTPLCNPFGIAKLLTIRNEGFPVCRVATDWLTLLDTELIMPI
jgi:hypothetical protein